jgi:hypothetical protein
MEIAVALAAGAVLLGAAPVAAGETSGSAMTKAQARKAYRNAVCPLDIRIEALGEAESAPDVNWATVQPLVQQVANAQIRTADKFAYPKRPWPSDIRDHIPALAELQLIQAGSNDVLAGSTSLDQYNALVKEIVSPLSDPLKAHLKAFLKARKAVHKSLGIPKSGAC